MGRVTTRRVVLCGVIEPGPLVAERGEERGAEHARPTEHIYRLQHRVLRRLGLIFAIGAVHPKNTGHTIVLVFGGWALGWLSATIARYVYPPPARWRREGAGSRRPS